VSWIANIFRRRKLYSDLDEEIRQHIEERAEQLMREGLSRADAEQAARRAFGNRTVLKEQSCEVWQWPTLESIDGDARLALRQLRRSPGFTLTALGVLGAMLAVTGIFGMAAYAVSKRLRELGIRIALGAQRKQVLSAALGRVLRLLAIGSAVGLLLGAAATKLLSYIVYQASPRDPLVLGGVVVTMLLLGLIAAWIPAQRALAADPLMLLREE
jgi:ABC-type antimicrobial peptide transport system permease subunit